MSNNTENKRKSWLKKAKRKKYQFVLSDEVHQLLADYSKLTGLNMSEVLEQAVVNLSSLTTVVTETRTINLKENNQ